MTSKHRGIARISYDKLGLWLIKVIGKVGWS